MKFKYKTILGIMLIEVMLVAVLIAVAETKLTRITHDMARNHSEATLKAIIVSSKEYIITEDQAKLMELGEVAVAEGVVEYIVLHDADNNLLVSLGNFPNPLPVVEGLTGQSYSVFAVIEESGFEMGRINIGVSFTSVNRYIEDFKNELPLIGLVGLLFSALFSWILGTTLSNRLEQLNIITKKVSDLENSSTDEQIQITGNDEISAVQRSFNRMAKRVKNQYEFISSTKVFYENIFNCSEDMLIIISTDGNIIQANRKFYEVFDCKMGEEKPILHYFKENSVNLFIIKCSQDQGFDLEIYDQEDNPVILNVSSFELSNELTIETNEILIRCTDMTKHYHLVDQAEAAKNIAIESVKQKDAFFANMSHEIRTPLNGVIGILNILKTTDMSAIQLEYLRVAGSSSKILLTVINDILDYSKIEAGKMDLDIQPTLFYHELMNIVSPHVLNAQEKGISLIVDYDTEHMPYELSMDSVRFGQIIHNLLSNSIKFTEFGTVTLRVKFGGDAKDSGFVLIDVIDTGIGMSEEAIEHLFTPFQQADSSITRKFGGTGLGTTIVKQLVALMQGNISVSSVPEKGTTFSLRLPFDVLIKEVPKDYYDNYNGRIEVELNAVESISQYNLKILLVEDNTINQIVAKNSLELLGCITDIANNGKEGLAALKTHEYDLVLMDMQMPVMDGITATQEWVKLLATNLGLSFKNKNTPIIAMTANASEKDRKNCFNAGMVDFITKPFEISDLEKAFMKWCKVDSDLVKKSQSVVDISIDDNTGDMGSLLNVERINIMSKQFGDKFLVILDQFINNSSDLLKEFAAAKNKNDFKTLKSNIHNLKGTSGTMGFVRVFEQCKLVEDDLLNNENTLMNMDDTLFQVLQHVHKESLEQIKNI